MDQDKTLNLSAGNYYFNSISAGGGLTLKIDLTSGQPINIYIVGLTSFGQSNTLMVKGAGTGGVFVPISSAQALASLIYFETHNRFVMGGGTDANPNLWGGTVYASLLEDALPSGSVAEVDIGQYIYWYGAVYAFDSIHTADHGHWYHVPLDGSTPVPEPASLLLLGAGLLGLARYGTIGRRR